MRLAFFALIAVGLVCAAGAGQEAKKKDDKASDSMKDATPSEVGGKTLDQWIKQISTKDPSKREQAMQMVLAFGAKRAQQAVPTIIAELKKHTPNTPIDLSVRVSGAEALGTILGSVKDPDPKQLKDAVKVLQALCKDGQVLVRTRAVQALRVLGPEAHVALNEVMRVAHDPDTWQARQAGLQTLTVLILMEKTPPSSTVLAVYYKALNDNSMAVRIEAIRCVSQLTLAPDSTAYATLLRNMELATKDVEPSVQIWAHLGVMTVRHAIGTDHLTAIAKMLEHHDAAIRLQSAQALTLIGKEAKPASGSLIAALRDPDPGVVLGCIVALARMEAANAVPALTKLSEDTKQEEIVKKAAKDAVEHISGKKRTDTGKEKTSK